MKGGVRGVEDWGMHVFVSSCFFPRDFSDALDHDEQAVQWAGVGWARKG